MSINSVKVYVANQAPSISLTGTIWKTVIASPQRLKRGKTGFNVFVMVGRVRRRESRMTSPRGSAEKEVPYEVDILLYAEHSDAQSGGNHFDALIENACQVYRGGVGNPTLTDTFGAPTTYLTDIGEAIDVDVLPSFFTDDSESRVAFQAVLTLRLTEVLSPA